MHFAALADDLTILESFAVLEEWGKESEGRLGVFEDLAVTSDPSLTEEDLPAFGRGSTLKMRYALDEVVEAVAVAMVARRRDAMRKFMLIVVRG